MIRRPPRSTLSSSSAASDVYKRQGQGEEVLWGRDGQAVVRVVDEVPHPRGVLEHQLPALLVEAHGPVGADLSTLPVEETQVVDHVAAAQYQHAALPQGGQPHAEVEMLVVAFERVDRQLDDRHVRVREEMDEQGPGAVVQAPPIVVEADPAGLDRLDDLFGDVR